MAGFGTAAIVALLAWGLPLAAKAAEPGSAPAVALEVVRRRRYYGRGGFGLIGGVCCLIVVVVVVLIITLIARRRGGRPRP